MGFSWYKFFATLLLLWAAIDLCAPQLCAAENLSIMTGTQQTTVSSFPGNNAPQSDNDQDDCFCCSMHVVPNSQFQIAGLMQSAPQECPLVLSYSEDSSRVLYPPPRS